MAKLNGQNFRVIKRLVHPNSGLCIAIRSDGVVLKKTFNGWKKYRRLKKEVTPEQAIRHLVNECGYIEDVAPEWQTLTKWQNEGIARAVDGCRVEPDGTCQHGYKSWLLIYGLL